MCTIIKKCDVVILFVKNICYNDHVIEQKCDHLGGVDGMNKQFLRILGLSLGLTVMAQTGHTAAIKDTNKPVQSTIVEDKLSPIEKALTQQKRGENKLISDKDQIKVLTSIKSTASQNFLAEQHQKFSRFVQALFQPHNS